MAWQRILCPIDFSDCSRAAMLAAARLAKELGAELTVLHAYATPGYSLPEGVMLTSPDFLQELSAVVAKTVAEWRREAAATGVAVTATTVMGPAFSSILDEAKKGGFDLIVMGTHGRTGLRHALLGSVAEKVVRLASCPVLTVRAEQGESHGQ
jgi:nucleotide-binding universal stress UspA family protein